MPILDSLVQLVPASAAPASDLVGRERELALIDGLLTASRRAAASLAIVGGPGIGKTALLEFAKGHIIEAGGRVLSATGLESESNLSFAGLHQLLRPVLDQIKDLPARQGAALRCVFGLSEEESVPDRFLIGIATLTLLAEVADVQPLLVTVDDSHWLDLESLEVLAFVTRRFSAEPIAVIVSGREEGAATMAAPEAPHVDLGPLDDQAANELLDRQNSRPQGRIRARVLAESAGNPLAVIELAVSASSGSVGDGSELAGLLPTARLERVFAGRFVDLPDATRQMLTVASAADSSDLRSVVRAAEAMGIASGSLRDGERAGLVTVIGDQLRFRDPVVRSTIYRAAPYEERRRAHLALAAALDEDPDRRAWHLAAATLEPDEDVAAALEATSERFRIRAGYGAAAGALERAASLSPEPTDRARRLVLAMEMAAPAGRAAWVNELAGRLTALPADPALRTRALLAQAYAQVLSGRGESAEALSVQTLESVMASPSDAGLVLLQVAAGFGFLAGDPLLGRTADRLVRRVSGPGDEPWRLYIRAASDPSLNGREIRSHLPGILTKAAEQPELLRMVAYVPWFIDEPAATAELTGKAIDDMRARGDFGGLPMVLVTLGFAELWRGRWSDAAAVAAEAMRIAADAGQPVVTALGSSLEALLAAMQGQADVARERASTSIALSDAGLVATMATWALGLEALSGGRYEDAYVHLRHAGIPGQRAAHFEAWRWIIADVVEAAIHSSATDDLEPFVATAEREAHESGSVRAAIVARRARALLSDGEEFKTALETERAQEWPFERARVELNYGEWLRRGRRIKDARTVLRSALDTFDRIGATPWAEKARIELRAAGVPLGARPTRILDELTPQQLQIAQLAARGFTNREIAAKVFLSPKTVAFHLYNVYPKLQITTRSQLARALEETGQTETVALAG